MASLAHLHIQFYLLYWSQYSPPVTDIATHSILFQSLLILLSLRGDGQDSCWMASHTPHSGVATACAGHIKRC